MYNSNSHPDPFAGQYPPPPPLQSPVTEEPVFAAPVYSSPAYHTPPAHTPPVHQSYAPAQQQPTYTAPYTAPQQTYTPPAQEAYVPPPTSYYQAQNYYHHNVDEERHVGLNEFHNEQSSLDDYLRQEREEYMKHEPKKEETKTIPFYKEEVMGNEEPEKTPMVQQPAAMSRKERKRLEKQKLEYQPYVVKPTLAPENEADSYKLRPYAQEKKSPCCCCYNPAITCCSFFCLLISVAFLAAGVAMMIASKVVTDKCNNQCADIIDQAQNACGTICSKVLHDGMLYGGIVVAALAGIAIVWKLIMWTCAGYSKR
ncbi:hypothetical protein INT47_009160 [Mucor saturninus]|uniref:Uncharacterized protein n=1 Tax=Mucor saturninus TaxID=64648 RepID=A0A8H7V7Y2_9FUNG|nr:hypothetical protein INT47_009160 [Mucor saturninus]